MDPQHYPGEPRQENPQQPVTEDQRKLVREVVGLFGSVDALQSAIDDLLSNGFDRAELSLLAEEDTVRAKVGDKTARELEDDDQAPRTPYIDSESLNEGKAGVVGVLFYVAAFVGAGAVIVWGGSAVSALIGAAGAGFIAVMIGLIVAKLIDERQRRWAQAQVRRGGLLLWARVWNEEHERIASDVMRRNGGADVHVHAGAA